MTDYAHPERPAERLSNDEREQAVAALNGALAAGRITPAEYSERSAQARAAVTRADLAPLFADLPAGGAAGGSITTEATVAGPITGPAPVGEEPPLFHSRDERGAYGDRVGPRPLGGAVGATIMALVPFVAIGLFFLTGYAGNWPWSWLWFMLIPIAGIVIYGPGERYRRGRGRDRRRYR